ncbi:MAG: hypothetical protein AB7E81_01240 [Hyphomicrobiaceae bacterium]|jgi:hypothetical protein
MTFLKTLLLATALALPITATHAVMTDITVEAATKKAAKTKKVTKANKATKAKKVKKAKKAKKAKKVAYKHCGTYKYWKGGKCMDARAKKA